MANTQINSTLVLFKTAKGLVNKFRFAGTINRDYDKQFAEAGASVAKGGKPGSTAKVRLPQRYQVTTGAAFTPTDTQDRTVDIEVTDQAHVGIQFGSLERTMNIADYEARYIDPAVDVLVNHVDHQGLSRLSKKVAKSVGTPGTTPGNGQTQAATAMIYQSAKTKLSEVAAPVDSLNAMLSDEMEAYLVNSQMGIFNPAGKLSEQYRTGQFAGPALGISRWMSTQNIYVHTTGALGGTGLVDGAITTEGTSSILTKTWSNSVTNVVKEGDVIQFAGVYDLNPQTYQSTGRLKDFVVTANVDSSGAGAATIPFSPAMQSTGVFANCSALPADGAAVTVFGHASTYASKVSPTGLIYDKDFAALVVVDLHKPKGAVAIGNKEHGIALRFLTFYEGRTDMEASRIDIAFGYSPIRQELACRVAAGPGA